MAVVRSESVMTTEYRDRGQKETMERLWGHGRMTARERNGNEKVRPLLGHKVPLFLYLPKSQLR